MHTAWQQVTWLIDDDAEDMAGRRKLLREAGTTFATAADRFLVAAVARAGTVGTSGGRAARETLAEVNQITG